MSTWSKIFSTMFNSSGVPLTNSWLLFSSFINCTEVPSPSALSIGSITSPLSWKKTLKTSVIVISVVLPSASVNDPPPFSKVSVFLLTSKVLSIFSFSNCTYTSLVWTLSNPESLSSVMTKLLMSNNA